ncbi:maleylpyruvate isomerase family mycothiol-dependent enzyme [Thermasporomyces composti]|uniref:Uncharacterized protein (TIGR03083 family) n=1 Tax=Thermasporomyces composti TaxID=696763 RepID=A0A3D9VJE7_THECX|nr:maleylpyruvate isomerase family mycothiol-dependent enzyme [Thermasporomyces composti]REF37461.1 uncharacterized protein (TIGR03083 family) [Thermasporomyces composti]
MDPWHRLDDPSEANGQSRSDDPCRPTAGQPEEAQPGGDWPWGDDHRLGQERYAAELRAETASLGALIRDADPAQRVVTCPDWSLAELVAHVGRSHRWAATIVAQCSMAFVPFETVDNLLPPEAGAERAAWLVEGARALVDAVAAVGPNTPVWSWTHEKRAGFWTRRILHETVIHRADAALTVGCPFLVAADVALDGILDWLGLLTTPRSGPVADALAMLSEGATLAFETADVGLEGRGARIRIAPDGAHLEPVGDVADVTVRAPAADLLLVIMRRLPPTSPGVEVSGDVTLLERWLARTAF